MTGPNGENTMTLGRLGLACLVGAAMWALIIWTGMRWWEILS